MNHLSPPFFVYSLNTKYYETRSWQVTLSIWEAKLQYENKLCCYFSLSDHTTNLSQTAFKTIADYNCKWNKLVFIEEPGRSESPHNNQLCHGSSRCKEQYMSGFWTRNSIYSYVNKWLTCVYRNSDRQIQIIFEPNVCTVILLLGHPPDCVRAAEPPPHLVLCSLHGPGLAHHQRLTQAVLPLPTLSTPHRFVICTLYISAKRKKSILGQ